MTAVAVGIDIGGTKIAAGLVEVERGQVLAVRYRATAPGRGGDAVLADCVAMAADLLTGPARAGGLAIGLGVPELVSPDGAIHSAFQFDWRSTDIAAAFGHLGDVRVESDVRAGAIAEATFGAAVGAHGALYVSIGTGISSCFLIDGEPWLGRYGNAIVLASGQTLSLCPESGTIVSQVVERIASGPALADRVRLLGGVATSGHDVLRLAETGDALAGEVATNAAQVVGSAIGQVVNVLDPDVVVLGGGLGVSEGLYRRELECAMRATIWSDASRDIPLRTSQLGAEAGLIGAALTAWRSGAEGAIR